MIADTRIAIIGLGLMGGSLARAVACRGAFVLGADRDVSHLDAAVQDGVVQERLDVNYVGLGSAEVVILALPVDAAVATLRAIAPFVDGAKLVMDLGSTKQSIVSAAESLGLGGRFVGAHPLTGSHRSGWGSSHAGLFDEACVFLCPARSTTTQTLALAESFWQGLNAQVELMDAAAHDEAMAWRSHLPHLASVALALALADAAESRATLGPGGRDMTRLAGSAASTWEPILTDNAAAIVEALTTYEDQLRVIRQQVGGGDRAAIRQLLANAAEWFEGGMPAMLTREGSAG